jgi:hypothetical protein
MTADRKQLYSFTGQFTGNYKEIISRNYKEYVIFTNLTSRECVKYLYNEIFKNKNCFIRCR